MLANAFGANTGDVSAHDLHLGHALGLVPLALIFGGILFAETRARASTEAFYWFAIVTMLTAATNVADLLDHDLHVAPLAVIAVLALVLVGGFARFGVLWCSLAGHAAPATRAHDDEYVSLFVERADHERGGTFVPSIAVCLVAPGGSEDSRELIGKHGDPDACTTGH